MTSHLGICPNVSAPLQDNDISMKSTPHWRTESIVIRRKANPSLSEQGNLVMNIYIYSILTQSNMVKKLQKSSNPETMTHICKVIWEYITYYILYYTPQILHIFRGGGDRWITCFCLDTNLRIKIFPRGLAVLRVMFLFHGGFNSNKLLIMSLRKFEY